MYNEAVKDRFIKWKMSTAVIKKATLVGLFNRVAPVEEELHKDLCNFTPNEIVDTFKIMSLQGKQNVDVIHGILKSYVSWCLSEGMVEDFQNHFIEINPKVLYQTINAAWVSMRIVTRETILEWCDRLPNASDGFLLLGVFEGVMGREYYEDFVWLTKNDIDVNSHTILLPERGRLKFSTKLCELGIEAAECNKYRPLTSAESSEKELALKRSDKVIKDMYNVTDTTDTKVLSRRVLLRIRRILKYLGVQDYIKVTSITDSGIIHYIKEGAKETGEEPKEFARTHLDEINFRFCKNYLFSVVKKRIFDYL